jgi:hypothetical protein
MKAPQSVPLEFIKKTPAEMLARSRDFCRDMSRRRTTRHFSDQPVPRESLLELAVLVGWIRSLLDDEPSGFRAATAP